MGKPNRYSPEVRERAVRMVMDHGREYGSQWATIRSIAEKIGCSAETLQNWVRQAERDQGLAPGLTTDERRRLKELERMNVPPYCRSFVCILLIALLALALASCDESTRPANHAPVISAIEADPPRITVGDTISLRVIATDADGDSLTYVWTVSAGELIDSTGVSVRWVTPSSSGEYAVAVSVSDGRATTNLSKNLSTEGSLVSGFIWGVWSREESPYIVVGDCTIGQLLHVTVEPGVEIRVRGPWKLLVYGGLSALGTEQDPVKFTSDYANPRPGDWQGIEFGLYQGPGPPPELPFPNELRWTTVEYAEVGVDAQSGWTAPEIDHCLIRFNSETGVFAGGGKREGSWNVIITDTRITNNGIIGVICTAPRLEVVSEAVLKRCHITNNGYPENSLEDVFGGVYCSAFRGEIDSCVVAGNGALGTGFGLRVDRADLFSSFHNCILQENAGFDLVCHHFSTQWDPGGTLDAARNYWGEATTAKMMQGNNPKDISAIYDKYDDDRLWEVDYSDWLAEEPEIPEPW